jgi:hypothetical protein
LSLRFVMDAGSPVEIRLTHYPWLLNLDLVPGRKDNQRASESLSRPLTRNWRDLSALSDTSGRA